MAKHILLLWCALLLCFPLRCLGVNYIKIGGVFPDEHYSKEFSLAFNLGIDYVNNQTELLPDTILIPVVNQAGWTDAFANIEAVYEQIYNGASAIIGPMTSFTVKATQPLCTGFHVPQLSPYATDPSFDFSPESYNYLVRMSPSDAIENRAQADFISYFNWTRFAVLTSRNDYGLNGLAVFKDIASHKGWSLVAVESYQVFNNISLVNATKQLFHIRSRGARIVVLNAVASHVRVILRQASDLGMIDGWVWFVSNGAFSFDGLYDNGQAIPGYLQGIVGVRHSFGRGTEYESFVNMWQASGHQKATLGKVAAVGHTFDAVLVTARAIHSMLLDGKNITASEGLTLSVHRGNTANSVNHIGEMLLDYISKVNTSGVMDHLAFDANRHPVRANFDIVNLRSYGFNKVGTWNVLNGLVMENETEILWSSGKTDVPSDTANSLVNQSLVIVTIEEVPFVSKLNHPSDEGKYILSGYCIDLLNKLQEKLRFSYEIYLVPDGNYGAQDPISKEWNGMVREILQGKAHLAMASFTISSERQKVIDFTQPYMDLGLTVLVKTINDEEDVFRFLHPFKTELWLMIGITSVLVGVFLWFFSTFSPFGFYGRCVQIAHHKVPEEHLKRRNTLRLSNSIWSTIAYLGQSAGSLHPVSSSGRITVTVWWLAILIFISSYTANLAAVLTMKRFSSPIRSIEDLASQNAIPYGTVKNSQPQSFFESSIVPSFVTMWQYMKYHHTLVKSSQEGIERVKNENYAFVWDSITLEHTTHTVECGTLTTTGNLFGKIGYGLGLPKDSRYTQQFNQAILKLRQTGFMDILEQRWLYSRKRCNEKGHTARYSDSQLSLADMAGVFVIVCAGVGIGFVVLIIEWLVASYAVTKENDPDAPKTLWESIQTRLRNTLHEWRHRDDVPRIKSFLNFPAFDRINRLSMLHFPGVIARLQKHRVSSEIEKDDTKSNAVVYEKEEVIDFQPHQVTSQN